VAAHLGNEKYFSGNTGGGLPRSGIGRSFSLFRFPAFAHPYGISTWS
jgi:hypothetical protein